MHGRISPNSTVSHLKAHQGCTSCLKRSAAPDNPTFWIELCQSVFNDTNNSGHFRETCNHRVIVGGQEGYGFSWIEVPNGPKLEERKKIFIKLARLVQPLMEFYKLRIYALVEMEPLKVPEGENYAGFTDFSGQNANFIAVELRSRINTASCVSFLQLITVLLHELAHALDTAIRGSETEDAHSSVFFESLLKIQRSYYKLRSPFKNYRIPLRLKVEGRLNIIPGTSEYPSKMQRLVTLRQLAFEERLNLEFRILTRMSRNRAETARWLSFDNMRRIVGFGRRGFEGTKDEDYFDLESGIVGEHRIETRGEVFEAAKDFAIKDWGSRSRCTIRKVRSEYGLPHIAKSTGERNTGNTTRENLGG
ncbi:hypothetical protein TWF718_005156 [Orbilia javanica]|uniref:WLM domain-containing protein n=1 Tax=Orbilia javanica TaxID=47235 RepID=A0AAN8MYK4_9PEZI